MQQLAGNENRPGQLGDTGIIVLKECDMGECDCIEVLKEEKKKKEIKTTESPSKLRRPVTKVRESSGFTRPLLTRTPLRRPAPVLKRPTTTEDEERIKFTDSKGNVRVGIVTGTSVSSSVTSSSSVNEAGKSQRLSPSELLRQRLKLYSQKRRLFL